MISGLGIPCTTASFKDAQMEPGNPPYPLNVGDTAMHMPG